MRYRWIKHGTYRILKSKYNKYYLYSNIQNNNKISIYKIYKNINSFANLDIIIEDIYFNRILKIIEYMADRYEFKQFIKYKRKNILVDTRLEAIIAEKGLIL